MKTISINDTIYSAWKESIKTDVRHLEILSDQIRKGAEVDLPFFIKRVSPILWEILDYIQVYQIPLEIKIENISFNDIILKINDIVKSIEGRNKYDLRN